jgi:hypothetical protein
LPAGPILHDFRRSAVRKLAITGGAFFPGVSG